jgi:hypothetical protein
MKPPLCSCGAPADYSVCVLVSSLGVRPRQQKCGRAQLFCASCILRRLVQRCADRGASGVQESLRSAYTALLGSSGPLLHSTDGSAQRTRIRAPAGLGSEGSIHSFADRD